MLVKHPGEYILNEMESRGIANIHALSQQTGLCEMQMRRIVDELSGITYKLALQLGLVFGTDPGYWIKLQHRYDQSQPDYHTKYLEGLKRAPEPTTKGE